MRFEARTPTIGCRSCAGRLPCRGRESKTTSLPQLRMVRWSLIRRDNGVRILALAAAIMLSLSMPVRGLPRGQAEQPPPSQTPAAKLTILSPAEESYVSGETTLRANLDPAGAASAVVFFVDGRQLCVVP